MDDKYYRTKKVGSVRELNVYKKAFEAAMRIFDLTKGFPADEKYSLVDQIRRSSRSVCSNLSEAWRKRKYRAVFFNKITDCSQEAAETQTWLEFALRCNYINQRHFVELDEMYEHVFAMLITMQKKSDKFCI